VKRLTSLLVDRGDLAESGRHVTRIQPGRLWHRGSFHPDAPHGVSACAICDRFVLRGMGRWWDPTAAQLAPVPLDSRRTS
jgi:hypothetical protein